MLHAQTPPHVRIPPSHIQLAALDNVQWTLGRVQIQCRAQGAGQDISPRNTAVISVLELERRDSYGCAPPSLRRTRCPSRNQASSRVRVCRRSNSVLRLYLHVLAYSVLDEIESTRGAPIWGKGATNPRFVCRSFQSMPCKKA